MYVFLSFVANYSGSMYVVPCCCVLHTGIASGGSTQACKCTQDVFFFSRSKHWGPWQLNVDVILQLDFTVIFMDPERVQRHFLKICSL